MIKVVQKGDERGFECTCQGCGSRLAFKFSDTYYETFGKMFRKYTAKAIICPECNGITKVNF